MADLQTFRQYRISQDRAGGTVELWRSGTEVACLAVDQQRQVFVELHVAISPVDERAFQQLVQMVLPLRHRHLLGVVEGGEDDGAFFYVTEFLDGERFESWLTRCGPLPPWLALQTLSQIISGLCVLAPHPRLLAGVELMHCGISLTGDTVEDFTARVCDLGLAAAAARPADPRQTEGRIIQETGRLLLHMLTGAAPQGPVEQLDPAAYAIPPELGFLLSTLFGPSTPHHPRTLERLRTLVDRCWRDLPPELAAPPEKIPSGLRPKLPLQPHFMAGTIVGDIAGDECTVETKPFDSLDPYRHRATQRSTRTPVTVQLLPPARLMPVDYGKTIVKAGGSIHPQEHPHLLRVLAWDEQEHPEILLEEYPGRWNLESMVRLKGKLEPEEAALILGQLEAAAKEAEACGLVAVIRGPRQILVQFDGPSGDEILPPDAELARLPLDAWPAFRVKVRTWPIALNFTQPERFHAGRLLPREPGARELHAAPARPLPLSQPPSAQDYALLAAWMLGGNAEIPERLRPLIHDQLSSLGGAAPGGRRDFVERFTTRAHARPVTPAPAPPVKTVPAGVPRAAAPAPAPLPVPAESPFPFGQEATPGEPDAEEEAPRGFAEALFGPGSPQPKPEPLPLFHAAPPEPEEEEEQNFISVSPFENLAPSNSSRSYEPEPELEELPPSQSRLKLWLIMLLVAAALGALFAHLSGLGFWLH